MNTRLQVRIRIHFSQTDLPVRGVLPANDSVRHIQDVVSFNHGVKFSWVDDEFGRYSFFVGRTEEKMGLFDRYILIPSTMQYQSGGLGSLVIGQRRELVIVTISFVGVGSTLRLVPVGQAALAVKTKPMRDAKASGFRVVELELHPVVGTGDTCREAEYEMGQSRDRGLSVDEFMPCPEIFHGFRGKK